MGTDAFTTMSQPSVSRFFEIITKILCNTLLGRYIRFPQTIEEKNIIKNAFYERFQLPGVIGLIDCTHATMIAPKREEEHVYFSVRKSCHTKNVQIICDANLRILSINARFGGSTHDSYIWRRSQINSYMQQMYEQGERNTWLLGDSGYGLSPWLMIPASPAEIRQIEVNEKIRFEEYNRRHRSARNGIERLNGVLKARFRILSKDSMLRYTPAKCGRIINCCAILHNILVDQGYPPDRGLDENDIGRYMDNNNGNHVEVGVLHPAEVTDVQRRRLGVLARLNMINNYCN